ncbi:MAG: ABC transporter substrate-binding protein [Microcella sp.]|uniref:ABC transporter substrate-binding protein n=1 Tax=Microcella sp. TaxID=1913979 RepID=UPI0024C738E4|nr:ABC transporter substrate-binding protein [Microcella sp.]UYN84093.1 MAG: ABC transporter substrate-binding protein [Microcella sp.]
MSRLSRRFAVTTAALVAAALALSACTPAGPSRSGDDTRLTVALPGSLSNLYVGQENGILNYYVASIAQEGLVSLDAEGQIQPALAESWEQVDDVTYVYTLRENATFHDGTPVTVDDVIFSIEKAQDAEISPGFAWYLGGLESMEETGERELTITLVEPDATFATLMSTVGALYVTSRAYWEANEGTIGTGSGLLMGTGPFQVTEFVPDSHVEFTAVDTWWGGVPDLESVRIDFIPDENTRLLAAQSGQIDVAFNVPFTQASQWESISGAEVQFVNDLSYVGLLFDLSVAPFDDLKVREAFAHAVDREAVVSSVLGGHGEVALAIPTPESLFTAYGPDGAAAALAEGEQFAFDLEAAAAALAASSVPEGFTTELTYPATGPELGRSALALAANLAEIGVTVNVREVTIEEWLATIGDGEHGVGYMWYFSTTGDPGEVISYLYGPENPSQYENEAVRALLAGAFVESDPVTRADLILEADNLARPDLASAPLWWGQSATAFLNGWSLSTPSPFVFTNPWPTLLTKAG